MAGLLTNAMDQNKGGEQLPTGTLAIAGSAGYDPEQRSIDAAKETVSGQLDSLLKSSSPYIERARAGAAQYANKRGLLNSSIAAGAGEGAAIDAALPIANADAGIYGTASRDNQAAKNTALGFTADASNKAAAINADASNKAAMMDKDYFHNMALQDLKGQQATTLANIEANYKSLIQTSASASQFFTTVTNNMAAVMADPNSTQEQKQLAVDKLNQMLLSGLTVIGGTGNVDIAGLLDFTGVNPALNTPIPKPEEPTTTNEPAPIQNND